jgi:polar amino acid transport system substrate-binding protein
MVFRNDGAIAGLEADFARALAEALDREAVFVELPWGDQIKALDANRIDIIMSAMSVTKERTFRVLFCSPYLRGGLTALVPREERLRYLGPLGFIMSDDTVAVQTATTGDFFVQQNMLNASRAAYPSLTDAYDAVARGRADLLIHDAPILWWLASERPEAGLVPLSDNLTTEYYAWAVRRGNESLHDGVNAVLQQWKIDGTLARIVRAWIPASR